MATYAAPKHDEKIDLLASLEGIETGALDVAEARTLLQAVLKAQTDEDSASEVFSSLRSWTGRMLRSSMIGEDLRAWHALFKAVAAQFRGGLGDYSVRINVLADLIYERVGMAETRSADDVLSRRHVRAVLATIGSAKLGRVDRVALGQELGIEQANLARVLTMMADAGLVARFVEGKTVRFELTALGATYAREVGASQVQVCLGARSRL